MTNQKITNGESVEEALNRVRELVKQILLVRDSFEMPDYVVEIAEQFQALDEWIINGGFLPKDWEKSKPCWHSPF